MLGEEILASMERRGRELPEEEEEELLLEPIEEGAEKGEQPWEVVRMRVGNLESKFDGLSFIETCKKKSRTLKSCDLLFRGHVIYFYLWGSSGVCILKARLEKTKVNGARGRDSWDRW